MAAAVRRAAIVTEMTILRLELGVAEAIAHRELGDRSRALGELEAHARTPAGTLLYCQVLAGTELVQAYLEQGDTAAAREELRQIEALVTAEAFGPDGVGRVARAGTLVALADGVNFGGSPVDRPGRRCVLGPGVRRAHRPGGGRSRRRGRGPREGRAALRPASRGAGGAPGACRRGP